jgi:site-specific DNA recombinase
MPEKHCSNGPARAVAYYRMSTGRQEASIPEQQGWARPAAKAAGVDLVREFEDEAVAGSETGRRGGLQALLTFCEQEAARGSPVQAVVCWDGDRFSRADSIRTAAAVARLLDAGVSRMLTPEGWTDWEDDVDRVLYNLRQDLSRAAYSKSLSKNVTRSALQRARAGLWVAGKPPRGYRAVPTNEAWHRWEASGRVGKEPDALRRLDFGPEPEVAQVRWMFTHYDQSPDSFGDVARVLNDDPASLRPRSGKWTRDAVRDVLTNRAYVGDLVWNRTHQGKYHLVGGGEVRAARGQRGRRTHLRADPANLIVVEGAHPALIDRETFARVQAKVQSMRWGTPRMRSQRHRGGEWVLSGLVRCGDCEGGMIGLRKVHRRGAHTYVYRLYACGAARRNGRGTCRTSSVPESRLLEELAADLREQYADPAGFDLLLAEIREGGRAGREQAEARLAALESRVADLDRLIGRGTDAALSAPKQHQAKAWARVGEWEAQREAAAAERAEMLRALDAAAADEAQVAAALEALRDLEKLIHTAPPDLLREALLPLVESITVHFDHSRPRNQCQAAEVEIEWRFSPRMSASARRWQ